MRRGTIIISSSPLSRLSAGYLVDVVDDAMGLRLLLSRSSRLSRQCKVIALTRAATVIRARVRAWLAKELRTKSLDWKATS